jgi:hypothetical protein
LATWTGCGLQRPLDERPYGELGRFAVHSADRGVDGVVVGVAHGSAEPAAVDFARSIRNALGARLVVAFDFKKKRIPVDQPRVHMSPVSWRSANSLPSGSVYPEFSKLLAAESGGRIGFYVGVRAAEAAHQSDRIEVASVGLSVEQLEAIKESFVRIRDEFTAATGVPKVEIALNTLDDVSWRTYDVKNHGVLMLADKGLILRLPKQVTGSPNRRAFRDLVTTWLVHSHSLVRDRGRLPQVGVERHAYGRINSLASRKALPGMVLAAPHGSFDWHTAELVEEMSYRTGLAAVITRGFTPTECGGWRINVNRPTERRYPTDTLERATDRARDVYQRYSQTVVKAAGGALELYIEIHQNGSEENIEVATVGLSRAEAQAIKLAYGNIRDRVLRQVPGVDRVNLIIEPADAVAIGAWAAKEDGMLRLATQSLHFELPAQRIFSRDRTTRAYTKILTELTELIIASRQDPLRSRSSKPAKVDDPAPGL